MKKVFVFSGIILATFILVGCEREGVVEIDDCREVININEYSFKALTSTFTCGYEKTVNGDIMAGYCVKVETTKNNECKKAYVYEKSSYKECPEDQYLSKSGDCNCLAGVKRGSECISHTDDCKLSYGENAYGIEGDSEGISTCYCSTGYEWNEDKTDCIISKDERCERSFKNSVYDSTGKDGKLICDCVAHYRWNDERTACVLDNLL